MLLCNIIVILLFVSPPNSSPKMALLSPVGLRFLQLFVSMSIISTGPSSIINQIRFFFVSPSLHNIRDPGKDKNGHSLETAF
jgi:hypothetical protein